MHPVMHPEKNGKTRKMGGNGGKWGKLGGNGGKWGEGLKQGARHKKEGMQQHHGTSTIFNL